MPIAEIWKPDTGITEFEVPWTQLVVPEITSIKSIWKEQSARLKDSRQLAEFNERLAREWAIETGIIENLYDIDRGVTLSLIEHGFRSELLTHGSTNKPVKFVIAVLNDQKAALENVFDFISKKRDLSTSYIKELHAAMLRSQDTTEAIDQFGNEIQVPLIKGDWKKFPNFPTRDDVTFKYCPPEQVASEMDRLIELHKKHMLEGVTPEVEAAWLHHRFTQIHPFQDGNGRIARTLASLVLMQAGLFPLVVNRSDRLRYVDALEDADNNNLKKLVDLVANLQRTQFIKATTTAENIISSDSDLSEVLGALLETANKTHDEIRKDLFTVVKYADKLIDDLIKRFEQIQPAIVSALKRVTPSGTAGVSYSDSATSHYYRSQIIDNAKNHYKYLADFSEYRAWVSLNLNWKRKGKIVFPFHGIGRPFSGSLVCAPFMEFRDSDGSGQTKSTLVPIADEPFVFFYNESISRIRERFAPWRENVLKMAVSELSQNL